MHVDYDLLARDYARYRQVHPGVLANLIQTPALAPASQVLEVGCGTGNYITALHRTVGCAGWGIDPSAQMLAQGRARAAAVDFRPGQAEWLGYPEATFDLLFSVDVIHHVQDRAAYFHEAYRVLKPGGWLCTVTDSAAILRARQPLSVYFPATVAVDLQRYPAISDLRARMENAGFGDLHEVTTEFAYPLTDLEPYRNKSYSCLHLIPAAAFAQGMARMEQDVQRGPIPCVARYLLLWGTK